MRECTDADLYGSKLHEVDLTKVQGLVQCQLSGTDLSNAQLPADAGKFASLEHVSDISVQARSLLWVTVGACFLAAVTMFVTTDGAIVAQSGSTLLPVVQINVPILAFFWLIPLILLSLYLYLHFHLQYLWDGLASLPSVFPDGDQPGREDLPPVSGRSSTPIRPNPGKESSSTVLVAGCCVYRFRLGTGPFHDISLLAEISSST